MFRISHYISPQKMPFIMKSSECKIINYFYRYVLPSVQKTSGLEFLSDFYSFSLISLSHRKFWGKMIIFFFLIIATIFKRERKRKEKKLGNRFFFSFLERAIRNLKFCFCEVLCERERKCEKTQHLQNHKPEPEPFWDNVHPH